MYSQCGCDVANCNTTFPNVTLFQIYYGSTITMNAPPLPANWWGGSSYAWFTLTTKTTDDPNQASQWHNPFINGQLQTSYTIDPLDYSANYNPSVGLFPTVDYFMCRVNSKASSGSSTTCFYGRSFKVLYSNVPAPVANVNTNISICQGDSIKLKATKTIGTLEWHLGSSTGTLIATTDSIWVKPTNSTSYFVKAKNGTSGKAISYSVCDTINITVNQLPIITSTSNPVNGMVCNGQSVILNGGGATTYTWTNGVSNGVAFSPSSTATYTVTGTDVNGCKNTAVKSITVSTPITPTITSSNGQTNLCSGVDYLTSSSANNYIWLYNGSTIVGATSVNYTPTQSGFYQTSGSDINGCNSSSSVISINVNPTPNASITPNGPTSFCQGGSVVLTTGSANSYLWSNSATTQSIVVQTGGNYSVTLTNANGCASTSSLISVTVYSTPITPTITQNTNVLMSSSSNNNQWYFNGNPISGATSQFYTATQSGFYSVSVSNSYSCSSMSASVNVVTTGMTQFDYAKNITVYPNPSNGILLIEFADNLNVQNYRVNIINTLGQVLYTSQITQQLTNVDLNTFINKGIYFIHITNNENKTIEIKKIILQ